MKRAVTLVELVFVIVIIGVLLYIGVYSFKPKYLLNDTRYVYMKILQTKYEGINYDKSWQSTTNGIGCIDLRLASLQSAGKEDHYTFHASISNTLDTLCFDRYGRAHADDNATTASSLITSKQRIITLSYKHEEINISVLPKSGYVIIDYPE